MTKIKATPYIIPPLFEKVDEIVYCINCKGMGSELYGTFAYDEELAEGGAGVWAISPVFEGVMDFYEWAKSQGFRYHDLNSMFKLRKIFM